jgi:putative ABC transport system substrate-binding protein
VLLSRRQLLEGGLVLASVGLLAGCGVAPSTVERPAKVPRIGVLLNESSTAETEAFRQGLRESGYAEGENIVVESRLTHPREGPFSEFVAELVSGPLDVIVTGGTPATRFARDATRSIPIVMAFSGDPVGNGLVESLARPGGNVTGLTDLASELSPKRLQLLEEAVPGISRIGVLLDPSESPTKTEVAAQGLGVQWERFEVRRNEELSSAFEAIARSRPEALFVERHAIFSPLRTQITEFAVRSRLPTMWGAAQFVEAGGLMAYGVNYPDSFRRVAGYVARILKGAKPADLPIEAPTKFDFAINLKTAQALGLTIPQSILNQATEVIQ